VAGYLKDKALEGAGSSTETHSYTWTDTEVEPGISYHYTLYDVDYQSQRSLQDELTVTYVTPQQDGKPATFTVAAVYPNPFNPSVTLQLSLQEQTRLSVAVFDAQGRQVATLAEQQLFDRGAQQLVWQARGIPAGIYFMTLQSADYTVTRKVVKLN
jgi:hypothetical protein